MLRGLYTSATGMRAQEMLIDNTAMLLFLGGHDQHALRRYWRDAEAEVAAALHAPSQLDPEGRLAWLERVGRARGVTESAAEVLENTRRVSAGRTEPKALIQAARRIHACRHQMLAERGD